MKIFFAMRHSGSIRFYEDVIRGLADDGHTVRIAVSEYHPLFDEERVKKTCSSDRIDCVVYPGPPYFWFPLLRVVRKSQDYLRYLCPEYKQAHPLKKRAAGKMPSALLGLLNFAGRTSKNAWATIGLLRRIDHAIPAPTQIKKVLEQFKPDVFLITPLVDFGSSQLDWLKSAKELRIRTCLCVGSWDNLTNKGLIQIEPEAVMVWNRHQVTELHTLHRLLRTKVFMTGAQCFDQWFETRPHIPRAAFLAKTGLQNKPYLLYLCSSRFISPREVRFVRKWIKSIRRSSDTEVCGLGILIRPHPQNSEQWKDVDLNEFENVRLYPKDALMTVDCPAPNDFYCSMFYSEAVVGINTSAMIEAGILGKPVLTIINDDTKSTQEGTLHFRYLVDGGLLCVARDYFEHSRQLRRAIGGDDDLKDKQQRFIKDFVRPLGLNVAAVPLAKEAILETAGMPMIVHRRHRLFCFLLQLALLPAAVFARWQSLGELKKSAGSPSFFCRALKGVRGILKKGALCIGNGLAKNGFVRERAVPWLITNVQEFRGVESETLRTIESCLKKASQQRTPIVIGPWLSEVGFEVLYWIPFLNWAMKAYVGIPRERIYVVSRGGAQLWYQHLSDNYADIFDYVSPEEFKKHQQERTKMMTGQKHFIESDFDKKMVADAALTFGFKEYVSLHPCLMYKLFLNFWRRKQPLSFVQKHSKYELFKPVSNSKSPADLPEKYIAVKLYFNDSFPQTKANDLVIGRLLERMSQKHHLIILESGINIDDHADYPLTNSDRIHKISDYVTARNNLDFQTRVLSGAQMFVGTYGGFSYLAAFYGKPAVAIYSREQLFVPMHMDVMNRVSRYFRSGECDKLVRKDDPSRKGHSGFLALDVSKIDMLETVFGGVNDIA